MAIEQFTNNAQTTLNGSITNSQTTITVTANTGFPSAAQFHIIIDSEIMLVTAGQGGLTWTVTRGNNLPSPDTTTNATHANLATVTHVLTAGALTNYVLNPVAGAQWTNTNLLSLTGTNGNYPLTITGSASVGQSFGEIISAGTTSADWALRVQNVAGTDIFGVRGDGKITGGASALNLVGALNVPPAVGTASPTTTYGTVPVKLDDQLLSGSAASVTFINPLPTGFRHLWVEWYARGDTAATGTNMLIRFNNDSAADYDYETLQFNASSATSAESLGTTSIALGQIPAASATANYFGMGEAKIWHYNSTVGNKILVASATHSPANTTSNQVGFGIAGKWRTTGTAITRLDLLPAAGNFVTGSLFTLWGMP